MLSGPISAQLEITEKCNYHCPHCYRIDNSLGCKSNHTDMPDEKLITIANNLFDFGVMSLVITGGEPLTRKLLTMDLIRLAADRNRHCTVNTNLVLANEKYLDELVQAGLDSMLISCPSTEVSTYKAMTRDGDMDKFFHKLEMVIRSKIRHTINMVVSRENRHQVIATAEVLASMGVKSFSAAPMSFNPSVPLNEAFLRPNEVSAMIDDLIWIKTNLGLNVDVMEALPKCIFSQMARDSRLPFLRRQCQAGRSVISVSPVGEVRPCSHNMQSYGNLLDDPLEKIWARMSEWRTEVFVPDLCHECKMLARCFGGCRINAKVASGKLNGNDPLCTGKIDAYLTRPDNLVVIANSTVIGCTKKFRWRKESDESYLVFGDNPNTVTKVSQELFEFIVALRGSECRKFDDIVTQFGISDREKLRSIIEDLTERGILLIVR